MKSEIIQTLVKEVLNEDLPAYFVQLSNPKIGGWKPDQIAKLKAAGFVERVAKFTDGTFLKETVRISPSVKSLLEV